MAGIAFTLGACSGADEFPNAGATDDAGDAGTVAVVVRDAASDEATAPSTPEAVRDGWTWQSTSGAKCDDGTQTGVGIFKTASPNLLVFMMGGGACWDYDSCVASSLSTHGPFGKDEFAGALAQSGRSALGTAEANPFASWNKIYVPYCTGDLHTGNHVSTYKNVSGGDAHELHHVGRTNVEAMVKDVLPAFTPKTVVISGSSAGGFGALFNYKLIRDQFPTAKAYLVDDAAPTLKLGDSQKEVRPKALASWGSAAVLNDLCASCLDQWADVLPALATRYADDRFALLSTDQDGIMRFFFGLSGPDFKASLNDLIATRYDTQPRAKYWIVPGTRHTFFGDPPADLFRWLGQMTTNDPAWESVKPVAP